MLRPLRPLPLLCPVFQLFDHLFLAGLSKGDLVEFTNKERQELGLVGDPDGKTKVWVGLKVCAFSTENPIGFMHATAAADGQQAPS